MILYLRRATSEDVARLEQNPAWLTDFMFDDEDEGGLVDFDKAWHALHFILCGDSGQTSSPLSAMLGNGENHHAEDLDHGGYWLLSPDDVRAFEAALSAITDADLAGRYDPGAFAEHDLYCADIFTEEGEEALPYLMQGVPALRAMTRAAAGAGDYIISMIS